MVSTTDKPQMRNSSHVLRMIWSSKTKKLKNLNLDWKNMKNKKKDFSLIVNSWKNKYPD